MGQLVADLMLVLNSSPAAPRCARPPSLRLAMISFALYQMGQAAVAFGLVGLAVNGSPVVPGSRSNNVPQDASGG